MEKAVALGGGFCLVSSGAIVLSPEHPAMRYESMELRNWFTRNYQIGKASLQLKSVNARTGTLLKGWDHGPLGPLPLFKKDFKVAPISVHPGTADPQGF